MEELVLRVHNKLVEKPEQWVSHKRSKNYIARITGFDLQYGFQREFLQRYRVGRKTYFHSDDFIVGEIYEIKCIYYSARGREHVELEGFFLCEEKTDSTIKLRRLTDEEAHEILETKSPLSLEKVKTTREIKRLENKKKILEKEVKALREAKQKLQNEIQQLQKELNSETAKQLRQELESAILQIAKFLLQYGSQKKGLRRFEKNDIKILEVDGKIKYVHVDDYGYVISQYKEPSISTLWQAFLTLKDVVSKVNEELLQIKEVVLRERGKNDKT